MKNDTISSSGPSARASRRSASLHGVITLALFALILIIINVLSFKHYWHRDLSQSQFYTLSPKTVDLLKHLDSPVVAHTILSGKYQEPIENLLKEYERVGGKNFTVDKIDPAYDIAKAADLQKRLQFDGTQSLIILEYKGRTRFVKQEDLYEINPMTQDVGAFKGEQQLTGALVALVEGKASKVYFTEGHGERQLQDADSPQGYGAVAVSLKNENVDAEQLNLAAKGNVPTDADAVVIAGPTAPFSPVEAQAIDRYLANNGKLLVLLDPYATLGLDDVLKRYGLQFDNDLVLYRVATTTGQPITVPIALIYQAGFSNHPITQKFAQANLQLQINGARSITMLKDAKGAPNPKVQFLLQTDTDAWGWVPKTNVSPMSDLSSLSFDKNGDIPGPVTIAAVYDGGTTTDPKTQAIIPAARIVAIGAAKFLQNSVAEPINLNLFANALDWLVKKDAVLDIAPKIPQEYDLSLSPLQTRTVEWTALIVVPGLALVLALFTWLSRRK
jgi:ABC-type uncharacterized transport system involved in gliding motility auxiliary subunit